MKNIKYIRLEYIVYNFMGKDYKLIQWDNIHLSKQYKLKKIKGKIYSLDLSMLLNCKSHLLISNLVGIECRSQ